MVAAACTPVPGFTPPQSQGNVRIQADTLTVIDHNNDAFGASLWDEPYLVNLGFRVQFGVANSASTFVVENVSNELSCPGGPNGSGFSFLSNITCSNGESSAVPAAMGQLNFPGLKLTDVGDLIWGYQPEVAGVFTFAYEEDQVFGSGNVAATVAGFAGALKTILNSTIAVGVLPSDGNAAAALIVDVIGDVALGFIGNTLLGFLSGLGNADDLIGIVPIIVVGINGTLASLANAFGLSGTAVLGGAVYTAGTFYDQAFTYTEQSIGGFNLGSNDTIYSTTWDLGFF